MRVGTISRPVSRYALRLSLLACLLGVGLSIFQVSQSPYADTRLQAMRSVMEFNLQHFSDPWPSIRAAGALAKDSRARLYDPAMTGGPAFIYPPIAALMYRPFIGLERENMFRGISLFNRIFYGLVYLLLMSFLSYRTRLSWRHSLGLAVAVICFYPLLRAVQLNQATLPVTCLLGFCWVGLQREKPGPAGIALAVAMAVKPQLVLILPLMFWSSRKMVFWALGTGGILLAISVVYAGIGNHLDYLTRMIPAISSGYAYYPNQSFNGLFNRMFLATPIDQFGIAPQSTLVQSWTIIAGGLTYFGAMILAWRMRRQTGFTVGIFGFAWLVTTLISPIAWEHHFAPALFVFVWLYREFTDSERNYSGSLLIPATVSFILISNYFDIFPLAAKGITWPVSYVFFGGVLLTGVVGRYLSTQSRESSPHIA